jgi:alpha-tubulin suppressor-like RCC1 family protein
VVCWGATPVNGLSAEINQPADGNYIAISLGVYHGCGILDSGVLTCWGAGQGEGGQYGAGQALPYGAETVPLEDNFLQVVSGGKHSCALRDDSTVTCWGVLEGPEAVGQTLPPLNFMGEE